MQNLMLFEKEASVRKKKSRLDSVEKGWLACHQYKLELWSAETERHKPCMTQPRMLETNTTSSRAEAHDLTEVAQVLKIIRKVKKYLINTFIL